MSSRHIVNTIEVPAVFEQVGKIVTKGGKVVEPKMAVPGVGHMAYGQHTEGNMYGIMQFDPKA